MTELLQLSGMVGGYSGLPVVRNLDLTVSEGEIVALLGPNGAGKTTTLLTISGMLPIIAGSVSVLGMDVGKVRRPEKLARRGVSHVCEGRALFSGLSVRENLRLGATGRTDAKRSVRMVLDYFPELGPLLNRRAGLLSGGEQQMLVVGRALVSRPKLLMIDEMSLGLAPVVVQRLLERLPLIVSETGCGALIVEQHVQQALGVADRAYVLNHGDLVAQGSASALRGDGSLLEATYLGEVSLDEVTQSESSASETVEA
jgi:branched-chain amino acid transport system ATP-binding protein